MNLHELPFEFTERLRKKLGNDFNSFIAEHSKPSPVSVRVNPFKKTDLFNNFNKISWATDAFYLPERISFTHDPLFQAGCYYVQEASSMFLEQALKIAFADGKPMRVLDLCAAPGGKSTHIISLMPHNSLLVSNEVISSRNKILQQNITKWGNANVVVTQNEVSDFSKLEGFFDVIVVDAPCSGEGLFRKDPEAVNHWSVENVAMCANRQETILKAIYLSLKKGGYLIYSTCTYEETENELQIKKMITDFSMESVPVIPEMEGPEISNFGTRFYPNKIKGEGFFIAMLRKTEDQEQVKIPKQKSVKESRDALETFFEVPEKFIPFLKNNELYAFPESVYSEIILLMGNLFIRKAGIHVGTIKGKDIIPSQELAMSIDIKTAVSTMPLSRTEALKYLRCETIAPSDSTKGWMLVTYENFPLGWIKSLGNRTNNYYPREWRILTKEQLV